MLIVTAYTNSNLKHDFKDYYYVILYYLEDITLLGDAVFFSQP